MNACYLQPSCELYHQVLYDTGQLWQGGNLNICQQIAAVRRVIGRGLHQEDTYLLGGKEGGGLHVGGGCGYIPQYKWLNS